jgi:hypothetical protein
MPSQSEQLEREAGQTRAQLSRTVEELRGRMTPGQMIDQLTNYAREGPAAEFRRNLAREVRENPLPLVLIGIGIGESRKISARALPARDRARHSAVTDAMGREAVPEKHGRQFIRSRPCAAPPKGGRRHLDQPNSAVIPLRKIPGSRPSA